MHGYFMKPSFRSLMIPMFAGYVSSRIVLAVLGCQHYRIIENWHLAADMDWKQVVAVFLVDAICYFIAFRFLVWK